MTKREMDYPALLMAYREARAGRYMRAAEWIDKCCHWEKQPEGREWWFSLWLALTKAHEVQLPSTLCSTHRHQITDQEWKSRKEVYKTHKAARSLMRKLSDARKGSEPFISQEK